MISEQKMTLLKEAQLETTLPERLRELATSKSPELSQAIASNPNTPTDVLWEVGLVFPFQVVENPVFDLLLLENPNLFKELPKTFLSILEVHLKYFETPASILEKIVGTSYYLDLAILKNPNTQADTLEKMTLRGLADVDTAVAVALHPNTPIRILIELAETAQPKILEAIASNTKTPSFLLKKIAKVHNWYGELTWGRILHQIGSNPNTPHCILKKLAKHQKNHIKQAVVNNPSTPTDILSLLVKDDFTGISWTAEDKLKSLTTQQKSPRARAGFNYK